MSLRVLVVPDKFKGTLTARAAAWAIARGWLRARPTDRVGVLPMSDGGDGFGEIVGEMLGARAQRSRAIDAAHRPCVVRWWWRPEGRRAVVESARVIGLAMLPPGRYHPFALDTQGLGMLLRNLEKRGCRQCLLGIGGSATNDAGFGLARALGWRFLDAQGVELVSWTELSRVARLIAPAWGRRPAMRIKVAMDVRNRLLGAHGATRVYGPQKGLRSHELAQAEAALRRLARAVRQTLGVDFARVPGAGAAGGLGFGLMAFTGATLEPGSDLFAACAHLDQRLRRADLVVTGEGALDRSSVMGKGVGEIARRCRAFGIPCVGLAGQVRHAPALRRRFADVRALAPDLTTAEEAKARAATWLARLAAQLAREWSAPRLP
jgi:glycerate kinase